MPNIVCKKWFLFYISWNKEKLLVKYVVYVLLMDCHCPLMIYLILNCPPDWYELTIIHKLVSTCFGKSQWKKIYLCRLDLVTFCTIAIMIIPPFKKKLVIWSWFEQFTVVFEVMLKFLLALQWDNLQYFWDFYLKVIFQFDTNEMFSFLSSIVDIYWFPFLLRNRTTN